MSMYIVSNDCLNDVANLIVKLNPAMDLETVFKKLLELNINIWNDKYDEDFSIDEYLKKYSVVDYSKFTFVNDMGTRFLNGYVEITQLVNSLRCYHYQISEPYHIKDIDDWETYFLIDKLFDNPLIKEISDYIFFNDLVTYASDESKFKKVKGVEWDR